MLFALGRRQARSARVYTRLRRGAGVGFGRGAASCEALCCLFGLGREEKNPKTTKKNPKQQKKKTARWGRSTAWEQLPASRHLGSDKGSEKGTGLGAARGSGRPSSGPCWEMQPWARGVKNWLRNHLVAKKPGCWPQESSPSLWAGRVGDAGVMPERDGEILGSVPAADAAPGAPAAAPPASRG